MDAQDLCNFVCGQPGKACLCVGDIRQTEPFGMKGEMLNTRLGTHPPPLRSVQSNYCWITLLFDKRENVDPKSTPKSAKVCEKSRASVSARTRCLFQFWLWLWQRASYKA